MSKPTYPRSYSWRESDAERLFNNALEEKFNHNPVNMVKAFAFDIKDAIAAGFLPFMAIAALAGSVGFLVWGAVVASAGTDKYNADFKVFCKSVFHGHAQIGDRNECWKNDKRVMYESDYFMPGLSGHYNSDFSRYCRTAGGVPKIASHDTCSTFVTTSAGQKTITIMRES